MKIKTITELVKNIELKEIYLKHLELERKDKFIISSQKPASIKVENSINGIIKNMHLKYEIKNITKGIEKNKRIPFFSIEIEYIVIFSLNKKCDIENNIIKQFGNISVMNMIYPFIREKILSSTSSMNLPPLLLEVHKIFVNKKK